MKKIKALDKEYNMNLMNEYKDLFKAVDNPDIENKTVGILSKSEYENIKNSRGVSDTGVSDFAGIFDPGDGMGISIQNLTSHHTYLKISYIILRLMN